MKEGACRHFTGIQNKACRAGVEYANVRDSLRAFGGGRFPCFGPSSGRCPKFSATTKAEAEQLEREADESINKMLRARKAIVASKQKRGPIDCPVCHGPGALCFAVHSNGHIHAICATEGCVKWME